MLRQRLPLLGPKGLRAQVPSHSHCHSQAETDIPGPGCARRSRFPRLHQPSPVPLGRSPLPCLWSLDTGGSAVRAQQACGDVGCDCVTKGLMAEEGAGHPYSILPNSRCWDCPWGARGKLPGIQTTGQNHPEQPGHPPHPQGAPRKGSEAQESRQAGNTNFYSPRPPSFAFAVLPPAPDGGASTRKPAVSRETDRIRGLRTSGRPRTVLLGCRALLPLLPSCAQAWHWVCGSGPYGALGPLEQEEWPTGEQQ